MTHNLYIAEASSVLPDITQHRLHAFHRRQLWLRVVRGLSATFGLFVLVLLLAVVVDALWLSDVARWIGCLAVCAIAGGALVVLCWLPGLKPFDPRGAARHLERLDPRLREHLLSAVELSETQPGVVDSTAFRGQLQTQVAHLVESIDVNHLLPWSRVQHRVRLTYLGLAGLVLLCLIPQIHFPQRVARVLFPFGDWGRVSRIAITLERPTPHSKLVPRDDIVAITARVDGPRPKTLTLETRSIERRQDLPSTDRLTDFPTVASQATASFNMTAVAGNSPRPSLSFANDISRFEYLLPARGEVIEYRIHGAGASTPWHRLSTLPRPRVIEFEKHISPPKVSDQAAMTDSHEDSPSVILVEDHGHIQALVGSQVAMRLTVDQPTSVAELRWEGQDDAAEAVTTAVPDALLSLTMRRDASSEKLLVDFIATRSGDYKVHLQSSDSNFTNTFSPSYHVRVFDDQAPLVTWLAPKENRLIASTEQIISLKNRVVDELPLNSLTRSVRVNGSDWQDEGLLSEPSTEKLADMRQASHVSSELDLQKMHLQPGDQIEVKLTAIDRQGQTGESSILQISVSSTSLVLEVGTDELQRREIAAGLQRIVQKLSDVQAIVDHMAAPLANVQPPTDDTLRLRRDLDSTSKLIVGLEQEINSTLTQIEEGIGQTPDVLNSQVLIHVGEALLPLARSTSDRLELFDEMRDILEGQSDADSGLDLASRATKVREQLAQTLLEAGSQNTLDQRHTQELVQHFEALTTYDVILRHAQQLSRLAAAQQQLALANQQETQTPQQLQRRQTTLTEQLRDAQRSVLDSLPLARLDTRIRLQQTAAQLGQQIGVAERFEAVTANHDSSAELARSLSEQLSQLRTLSRLDPKLPTAMKIALRRLSELAPPTRRNLDDLSELLNKQLPADKQTTVSLKHLTQQRELQRAAPQGDRLFAGDLGNTQRALESLSIPTNANAQSLVQPIRDISAAIATLQAIHQVAQADMLLAELLNDERVESETHERAWRGPRTWDAIEQRFEQAITSLREAQIPNAIVQQLNDLRNSSTVGVATRKFNDRLWQAEPPQPAAADLEKLRLGLNPIRDQLNTYAQQARRTLSEYAPKISELAQQAAEEIRDVEQQSLQLADSIERQEVPNIPLRLEHLGDQTVALNHPMDRLRDALVDQADAQNLLDRRQTQMARRADAAIELVDRTSKRLEQSQTASSPVASAATQATSLREAAEDQSLSADALQQLASVFENLEAGELDPSAEQLAEQVKELAQQAAEFVNANGPGASEADSNQPDRYAQAEELANLAEQDPQSVLEQLERELKTNQPMSQEMSAIARQSAHQSLAELEQAAGQQQELTNALEMSDPHFRAQKELLLHDLHITGQGVRQMLDTIVSQAKWTTGASRNETQEKLLVETERQLRNTLDRMQPLELEQTFEQLRELAAELQSQLTVAQLDFQTTGGELAKTSFEEFHQSGADLANRRREMRDRQRRVQQESVRDAQTIERNEQQRLQQLQNEVHQAQQLSQRSEKNLQDARQQLEKRPEQAWLAQQIPVLEGQLELALERQNASKKLQDAIARRAELARTALEGLNSLEQNPLDSVNPTAQLAAQLSKQAAEASGRWAEKLRTWDTSQLAQAQATAAELTQDEQRQQQIGSSVAEAASGLSRAARHEARLQNSSTSAQLDQAAVRIEQVVDQELQQSQQQLSTALEQAVRSGTSTAQASPEDTQAAQAKSQVAQSAIERSANSLREMLASNDDSPASASPETPPGGAPPSANAGSPPPLANAGSPPPFADSGSPPLDAARKARLLDELDRRLNGDLNLGEKEDNSQPAPSGGTPGDVPPTTLTDAASQLAQSLSSSRQPATPSSATADLGSATESLTANAEPQSPVAVRVVEVDRRGGNWGDLREQTTEELAETRRETIAPRFRKQVEAYFRELAERGSTGILPANRLNERE